MSDVLATHFDPLVADWFRATFATVTAPQRQGWPAIARGSSTLILAPTGSGKTLAAFLWSLNRLMFEPPPDPHRRCRVLYLSPLKALAVDVERNLRGPLTGISSLAAARGRTVHEPIVSVRTGDTPPAERARFLRSPGDILITTPESLFLLLTSRARETLRSVETIIVDEIHALVATKRGAHLALSLERLEHLTGGRLQRIGLSATQRPLEEVAHFLGGANGSGRWVRGGRRAQPAAEAAIHAEFADAAVKTPWRPVTIVDASAPKRLDVRVQAPVEDMATMGRPLSPSANAPPGGPTVSSAWQSIHPALVALIRAHRSTLVFVNSRRLAERLASALNDEAGEPLARAHHGSLARVQRVEIEDQLKAGTLPALVATSSLELGIDMGAIDLVVQIEAPPSVASGLQRIGRAGHRIDEVSRGIVFPKFRGDLAACAAVTAAMQQGEVETSRFPRNPLDVLAQQIVAMAAVDAWSVDELFALVRSAAPFTALSLSSFDGVLDMLSGRYPSDEFAELRPRITWDRTHGIVTARQGAGRVAIANAGTIPDRGLYGVFLAGADRDRARVGELDEEMVFEARAGETFMLGASTWRIEQITHDRVIVSPAPGQPGRMPFWKGEGPGRPVDLGRAIGALVRRLHGMPRAQGVATLEAAHGFDAPAATNLLQYLDDQHAATGAVPDDRTVVVERSRDDLGDWRISVLSPLGSRVHAPWAMAATARIRDVLGVDVQVMWNDDGFVVRYPDGDRTLDAALLVPEPEDAERLVVRQLGATAMFAARFREAAGRALLLPRRRPGARSPLWQQRKRAADLLAVAGRYGSFPIILEAYRECLRDVFDLPALVDVLDRVQRRTIRVVDIEVATPSPFAASLALGYVAKYLYDGDAPLAERRAQALSVDQAQLRDLIGDGSLRDLLDTDALVTVESDLQRLPARLHARSVDAVHDLLLSIGDLSPAAIAARTAPDVVDEAVTRLVTDRRLVPVRIADEERLIAVEDAARYRDALGVRLPRGLPKALLSPVADPLGDLVRRFARTHGPFRTEDMAHRWHLGEAVVEGALVRLAATGRVLDGEFRPGGQGREWCDAEVLRGIRRRSLARLRHEVEAVAPDALARFLVSWHGVTAPRAGLDAVLDVVERLQGVPIAASVLEQDVLPARVGDYAPEMLDTLLAAGEVSWVGLEPLGERDGRVALYLADGVAALRPPDALRAVRGGEGLSLREARLMAALQAQGAAFFAPLHEAAGGGFPQETVDALWALVWRGLVTNDTLHPLRAYLEPPDAVRRPGRGGAFRSRRLVPPSAEGRWTLVAASATSPTAWTAAMAQQVLMRHGLVTRESIGIEQVPGGFSALYPVLQRLEDTGRIRRGYFVAGLGAAQFAQPAAVDQLRDARDPGDTPSIVTLSSTDPANPYGITLPWPGVPSPEAADGAPAAVAPPAMRGGSRTPGTRVVLVDGRLACWIARGQRALVVWMPVEEPGRTRVGRALAAQLVALAHRAPEGRRGWLVEEINGHPAARASISHALIEAGFVVTSQGLQLRVPRHA